MDGEETDWWSALHEGYLVYRELTCSPANKNVVRRYFKFLTIGDGNAAYFSPTARLVKDNEVAKERLKWLTGPNAETYYKIWKIRDGQSTS